VYGRTYKVRDPRSGKRVYRRKPESTWTRVENPGTRIVSDELWAAVRSRLDFVLRAYGDAGKKAGLLRSRLADSPYIFSGLLKCAECGGSFTIVAGASGRRKYAVYGCASNAYRGTCQNSRRIGRHIVERELLQKLQGSVLSPAAIDYCFNRLKAELSKHFMHIDGDLEKIRRRKVKLEAELRNLTQAVAEHGLDSPSLRRGIVEREAEISALTANTLGRGNNDIHVQIRNLRKFVENSLAGVRELLTLNGNAPLVRMELAKHIDSITVGAGDLGAIRYRGKFKLLGDSVSWDGAEGQNRTGYAGLFRAALYQ
jgi:hypothetical protein